MKQVVFAMLCLFVIGCSKSEPSTSGPTEDSIHEACGFERWDVKNLLDAESSHISFAARLSSISEIDTFARITVRDSATRMSFEEQTLSVPCTIVAFKQEDDSDLHLILRDALGDSMIAEIPNVACMEVATSTHAADFIAARAWATQHLGQPKRSFVKTSVDATVTGVLFQDFAHGQKGHATNYMELHPILKIE